MTGKNKHVYTYVDYHVRADIGTENYQRESNNKVDRNSRSRVAHTLEMDIESYIDGILWESQKNQILHFL